MPQRREGIRTSLRLLGSLAVVLIPFGIYSYLYFDRQYDYHVNRNFRVLTEAGQHLSAILEQFEKLLESAPKPTETKAIEREIVKQKLESQVSQENHTNAIGNLVENKDFMNALDLALRTQEELEGVQQQEKALQSSDAAWKKVAETQTAAVREFKATVPPEDYVASDLRKEYEIHLETLWEGKITSDFSSDKSLSRLVHERFKERGPKDVVKKFLVVVDRWSEGTGAGEKGEEEELVAKFMEALKVALAQRLKVKENAAEANLAWNRVAEIQSDKLSPKTFERDMVRKSYKNLEEDIKEEQREEEENLHRLRQNTVYKNIDIEDAESICKARQNPVNEDSRQSPVEIKLYPLKGQSYISVTACQQEQEQFAGNFEATLPFADLMRNTDAEAGNLDMLVLAQEDGTVIYSSTEAPSEGIPKSVFAQFSSLKPFFQQDQAGAATKETTPNDGQSSIPFLSIIQEAKEAQMSIPLVSVIREAEISGTTYLLFLQPFHLPVPIVSQQAKASGDKQSLQSTDGRQVWYLGGIIRKGEFQKEFLAVPLTVTGLAVLGLILGILSLPYIKLFFVNAGEPLKATDIFFLVVSLVLSSGLLTLLLLNTVAYHNIRAQFDKTAEKIGERIQKRFGGELERTLKDLSKVPEEIWPKKEDKDLELLPNRYPPYESIFLVDKEGWIEPDYWGTYESRRPTRKISIPKRQYFTHARDEGGLWQKGDSPKFFIERVHSYNDGVKISAVSRHCDECGGFVVAALAKRFLSFRALALPPNFGFTVIENDTGNVIFHSDDQRSLIENFFWETDNNLALQGAVHARQDCKIEQESDCKISGYYNGRKHHFFVTPIESVPWSLVVFYDTRLLETVNFEIGVIAAGIFFLYVAIFGLVIALIHFFRPRERWSWCWPQSRYRDGYAFVAALLVLVVLSYGLGIWLRKGWPLLLPVVPLPWPMLELLYSPFSDLSAVLVGVLLIVAVICSAWIIFPKLSFRFWYLSIVFLSLLVVSVLPSAAIFKDAFLAQSERFTEFRESEFMAALEKREKTLLSDIDGLAEREEVEEKINTKSKEFIKDAIKPGLYEYKGDCLHEMNQHGPCKENVGESYLSEWFIDFLPVYNKLAGKLRYPMSEQAGPSRSEYSAKLQYQAPPSLSVFRPLGSWSLWIVCLGLPIFLLVLFMVIRALAKRTVGLYLLDFEVLEKNSEETTIHNLALPGDPDKETIGGWVKAWTTTDKNRRILVRPPRDLVSKLEKHADKSKFEVVDLSSPIPSLLGQLREWSTVPSQTGILVKNFESGILEPRLRLALLEALERVWAEIPVILCSSVSPLYRLVTPEAYPEFDEGIQDAVPKADEKFRWSALLSTFRKERFWYKADDWRKKKDKLQILSRECCWTDELMPIYNDLEDKVKYLREEQIIHQVGDRAEAFYRKLWMLCTKEERLVLIRLAQGNLVNLKDTYAVQRLMWHNLIRRDPAFGLPNESLARFILTAEPPVRVAEWEKREADGSTWATLRVPFLLFLVLVAVFIARTGGEGVQAMAAIVSAVFAGLPILIQIFSFLRGGQTDKLVGE